MDEIKAALRAAAPALNGRLADRGYETTWTRDGELIAAAAIAAFLRALPLHNRWGDRRDYYPDRMADEVERAAKDDAP